jgi:hypothetical protein
VEGGCDDGIAHDGEAGTLRGDGKGEEDMMGSAVEETDGEGTASEGVGGCEWDVLDWLGHDFVLPGIG